MRIITAALAALFIPAPPAIDWNAHFTGVDGTFVLLDARTGEYTRYNASRAAARFAPCSTYKVPNTAILLESGAVSDPEFTLRYDPALKIENPDWARDHSLRTAFQKSALWYYQEMSRRAGMDVERRFVNQFGYGNGNTAGGVDRRGNPFWVDGALRISADEQVRFLQKLHDSRLGLSERTTQLTKEIMVADRGDGWTLSAKTGACHPSGEDVVMWYVGWVEKGRGVYYFAFNVGDTTYERLFAERVSKPKAILRDLGVLPG